MPPFRFRAQAVLDLRTRAEEAAERALAAADEVYRRAEAAREAAVRAQGDARARAAEAAAHATGVHELTWYRNWIVGHQRAVAVCQRLSDTRRTERDAARSAAERARRDRMAVEKLKDRARRAYQDAERRAEQKALDELATIKHATRRQSAGGQT